uniref:Uncharacterized protein n=1 Tax=Anguilla anguilla TaxID=7936 RepID=A0A0E9USR8_ANGAN
MCSLGSKHLTHSKPALLTQGHLFSFPKNGQQVLSWDYTIYWQYISGWTTER